MIRKLRGEREHALPLAAFKALVRDQFLMLLSDEERAVAALPGLIRGHEPDAARAFAAIGQVARARGDLGEEAEARLRAVGRIFGTVEGGGGRKTGQVRSGFAGATGTAAE